MNQIDELIKDLAKARAIHAEAKEKARIRMEEILSNDTPYFVQKSSADSTAVIIAELETRIRELALQEYAQNGTKAPHPKVAIKIFKTFKVHDASAMRKWVFSNLPAALKVDEKKVEKYAHEFGAVDGAETGEEPRAQIASTL